MMLGTLDTALMMLAMWNKILNSTVQLIGDRSLEFQANSLQTFDNLRGCSVISSILVHQAG
jgi:hypothetical protein